MENLKIRVSDEKESKEAQELFFELGGTLGNGDRHAVLVPSIMGLAVIDGLINFVFNDVVFIDIKQCKEITLGELRDMVVLKRNDVGDATHKGSITDNVYYVSSDEEVYRFESSAWCFSTVIVADLEPIEKPMKEYLRKNSNDTYSYIGTVRPEHVSDFMIEIPEGCNIITCENRKGNLIYFHWKSLDSDELFLKDKKIWSNNFNETLSDFIEKNEGEVKII